MAGDEGAFSVGLISYEPVGETGLVFLSHESSAFNSHSSIGAASDLPRCMLKVFFLSSCTGIIVHFHFWVSYPLSCFPLCVWLPRGLRFLGRRQHSFSNEDTALRDVLKMLLSRAKAYSNIIKILRRLQLVCCNLCLSYRAVWPSTLTASSFFICVAFLTLEGQKEAVLLLLECISIRLVYGWPP